MSFGPDGYLYIGLGDGGSGGDPLGNGQNPNTLLGKLLRIDVNQGDPYAIPGDNAFAGGGGSPEVFATGLRNPWKFSFDRATGDLYIGDVGQNIWEEINFLPAGTPAGTNFGWNLREGANPYENASSSGLTLVDPVAQYKHPEGCSVTGGFVYRGEALADFQGVYLYGDFCNGRIWGLLRGADGSWQNQLLFETGINISSFAQDDAGELYLVDHYNGAVLKLVRR
jgi:glucose/arabinose dehydrogenase